VKIDVKSKLELQSEVLNDFYLGMPTLVKHSLTATFSFLYNKNRKYINGLSYHTMSGAGNNGLSDHTMPI
jgi:hypothetical protein